MNERMSIEEQLEHSLGQVSLHRSQVRKTLESPKGKLLVAIKQASAMLNELRVARLPPQMYYELYNACFDTLSQLEEYLIEDQKNHHLADVYEIVQYTATVLPRLYLMITVGTAFLATPGAPRQEVLKDMLEMSRGIQSPLRGLFLRYYLAQRTGSYLMTNTKRELEFSVQFTLTNFIEMNKLWVRYQHDGLSSTYDQRTEERKQLKTIVGSSILRLSQLDTIDLAFFGNLVLPALLGQVVQCRDKLAQEYILDILVQVFPAEYHLETLPIFLDSLKSLLPETSVPSILQGSIKRITEYAELLEAEKRDEKLASNLSSTKIESKEELPAKMTSESLEAEKDEAANEETVQNNVQNNDSGTDTGEEGTRKSSHLDNTIGEESDKKENVADGESSDAQENEVNERDEEEEKSIFAPLIAEYWSIISSLKASSKDRAMLVSSLMRLSEVTKVPIPLDSLFAYLVSSKMDENAEVENLLLSLFDGASYSLSNVLSMLRQYPSVLSSQSKETRHKVAEHVVNHYLQSTREQDTSVAIDMELSKQILDLMTLLLNSGGFDAPKTRAFINLLKTDKVDTSLDLLMTAHSNVRKSGKPIVRTTSSIMVVAALDLFLQDPTAAEVGKILKFCNKVCHDLATVGESPLVAYRLYVTCATAADNVGSEDAAYELFVQALSIYEEYITESTQQVFALAVIIQALQQASVFTSENYDPLAQRCLQYGQRLMKKPDQCRSLLKTAHLFWDNNYADARRVEETLGRALRSADSVMDIGLSIELFLDVIDTNLYFLGNDTSTVTVGSVNSIIKLIKDNLATAQRDGLLDGPKNQPTLGSLQQRWYRTQQFIKAQQNSFPRFQGLDTES